MNEGVQSLLNQDKIHVHTYYVCIVLALTNIFIMVHFFSILLRQNCHRDYLFAVIVAAQINETPFNVFSIIENI